MTEFFDAIAERMREISNLTKELSSYAIQSVTLNKEKKITTVVFGDGETRMVKCGDKDTYSPEMGIVYCIALKYSGLSKTQFKELVNKLVADYEAKETKVAKKKAKAKSKLLGW